MTPEREAEIRGAVVLANSRMNNQNFFDRERARELLVDAAEELLHEMAFQKYIVRHEQNESRIRAEHIIELEADCFLWRSIAHEEAQIPFGEYDCEMCKQFLERKAKDEPLPARLCDDKT